jgi:hypothetical protein
MFSDTPLPPEEPTGQNPPEGAILDYYLPGSASEVTLEIVDGKGEVVRKYSSDDPPEHVEPDTLAYPTYWFRPEQSVSTEPGHHRFVWDLRYAPPPGTHREYSIAAVYKDTPTGPRGPFVHPGSYAVRLTVDGDIQERPIDIRLDPRVDIRAEDLQLQTDSSMMCYRAYLEAHNLRRTIDQALESGGVSLSAEKREQWSALLGSGVVGDPNILYGSIYEVSPEEETVIGLQRKLVFLLNVLQEADARPTSRVIDAVKKLQNMVPLLEERWEALQ